MKIEDTLANFSEIQDSPLFGLFGGRFNNVLYSP